MKFVKCYERSKSPIGDEWQNHAISYEDAMRWLADYPSFNLGILLGPGSGVIDAECDSAEATENFPKLFREIQTPSWQSTRGGHHLLRWDDRLARLGAVVK